MFGGVINMREEHIYNKNRYKTEKMTLSGGRGGGGLPLNWQGLYPT